MAAREQLRELKLNVTNIKSVLVKGKEEEKRIKSKRVAFVRKDTQREKRIEKEKSVEKFRIPTLGVGNFVKNTASTAFGGIMGFLSNILTGYIVLKLPEIIAKAREVYDTIKPIWDGAFKTLSSIFSGVGFVYTKITSAFNRQEADKNLKEQEKLMNTLDKEVDSDIKFFNNVLQSEGKEPIEVEGEELIAPSSLSDQSMGLGTPDPAPGPKMTPQPRNMGGEILNTTQPRIQDQRDDKYSHNPIRLFPKVANKTVSNTQLYKQNVEKFGQIIKSLRKSSLKGGDEPGGSDSPASARSGRPAGVYPQTPLMGKVGEAYGTGLKTGASRFIGESSEYHIDTKFPASLPVEQAVAMVDQMSRAYAAKGREIEFSNSAVSGLVYDHNASSSEKLALLKRVFSAHAPRNGWRSMDYYIPLRSDAKGRFGSSVEGAEIVTPTVAGGKIEYHSGGRYGAFVVVVDSNGKVVSKTGHGDIRGAKDGLVIDIPKKNLGPVASSNTQGSILLQTIVKEKIVQQPVPVASLNSSGGSNASNYKLYNEISGSIG